jgi:hypothetical protein
MREKGYDHYPNKERIVKRLLLILGATVAAGGVAAAPAVAGLTDNPSFSHQIPVRAPSQAQTPLLIDDHGRDGGTPTALSTAQPSRSAHPEPGDDRGGISRHVEPGDDRGGATRSAEPGDDRGGASAQPTDDRGGSTRHAEPGDDHGGSTANPAPGDDRGGSSGHGGGDG